MVEEERQLIAAEIAVLRAVAAAFGIGQKSFGKINRMRLGRSARGTTKDLEKLRSDHATILDAVLRYFRRHGSAGSGGANEFSDLMLMASLYLYPRVQMGICGEAAPSPLEVQLLVKEVLVPTAFAIMLWRSPFTSGRMVPSLGHEFDGPMSWYLPEDGRAFCSVWDRWLRVTSFRTPCGLSRDSAALKDQGKRWLKGRSLPPSVESIDRVVTKYADRVEWLDDPSAWKARLRLGRAIQYFGDRVAEHCRAHALSPSPSFHRLIEEINVDGIVCDPDGWLASPRIFFAVRLIQRRLGREKRFEATIGGPTNINRQFSEQVPQDSIEQIQERDRRRLSPGYRFLRYLARRGQVALGSVRQVSHI
jgi:hypothetical protein